MPVRGLWEDIREHSLIHVTFYIIFLCFGGFLLFLTGLPPEGWIEKGLVAIGLPGISIPVVRILLILIGICLVAYAGMVFERSRYWRCRVHDKAAIRQRLEEMKGYWEMYHYAMSRSDASLLSRSLLIVRRLRNDRLVGCQITDRSAGVEYNEFEGYFFQTVTDRLCLIFEEKDRSENLFCFTRLKGRHSREIYGIILGLSHQARDPSAAKVAFRYLGREQKEVIEHCSIDIAAEIALGKGLEDVLISRVGGYVDPSKLDARQEKTLRPLIDRINNEILSEQIPLVLRMVA